MGGDIQGITHITTHIRIHLQLLMHSKNTHSAVNFTVKSFRVPTFNLSSVTTAGLLVARSVPPNEAKKIAAIWSVVLTSLCTSFETVKRTFPCPCFLSALFLPHVHHVCHKCKTHLATTQIKSRSTEKHSNAAADSWYSGIRFEQDHERHTKEQISQQFCQKKYAKSQILISGVFVSVEGCQDLSVRLEKAARSF